MQSYMQETKVPAQEFMGVGVADSFFAKVEEEKADFVEEEEPKEPHPMDLVGEFLNQEDFLDLRNRIANALLPGKYEYLMKVCALLSSGESNFTGVIEISRFMTALSYIESSLSIEEVWLLAEVSNLGSTEEDESQ